MPTDPSKCGRRYDLAFKQDAVALVQSGRAITAVARDLGVSIWSLQRWVHRVRAGQALRQPQTLEAESPQERELRRLRQDLEHVRQQRDILKKALGILSAEMPPRASS